MVPILASVKTMLAPGRGAPVTASVTLPVNTIVGRTCACTATMEKRKIASTESFIRRGLRESKLALMQQRCKKYLPVNLGYKWFQLTNNMLPFAVGIGLGEVKRSPQPFANI